MRFLQSSDFHLSPDRPERLDALREVASHAARERADVLLIPGDLFDGPAAATALRNDVRTVFESFAGAILLIPGNHDLERDGGPGAYPPGADLGRNTTLLDAEPFAEHALAGGIRVIGVPFRAGGTLGRDLAGLDTDPLATVLLAHGTYQVDWVARIAGSEGDEPGAYYPIRPADLEGRFAYAALGHFHGATTFEGWRPEAAWGYAGSPVAISRGEIGPRRAVVVDFEPGHGVRDLRALRLDTPYWDEARVSASPQETLDELCDRVRSTLSAASDEPDAQRGLRVALEGWIDGDETVLRSAVERIVAGVEAAHRTVEIELRVQTVGELLRAHPWLGELLDRVRRLAAERQAGDAVLQDATAMLVEAAAGARR